LPFPFQQIRKEKGHLIFDLSYSYHLFIYF